MEPLLLPLLIFVLRVLNNSMGTIRVIVMTGGRRWLSFTLAFTESLIFAYTAGKVLTDLNNIPNLMAYATGFAVGNLVGIMVEERFVKGYATMNIISIESGHEIAEALRQAGYGVTELTGEGAGGEVKILRTVIDRQDIAQVTSITQTLNPNAFITTESTKSIRAGWMREARKRHYH